MRSLKLRLLAAPLLALTTAVTGIATPAWAGENRGMCNHADDSRGKIPDSFPIDACLDNGTLVFKNTTNFPVVLSVTGDNLGTPKLSSQGEADGPAAMLAFIRPGDFDRTLQINGEDVHSGIVPPNYHVKVNIGNHKAKIHVDLPGVATQKQYAIAEAISRYTPLGGSAKAVLDFVNEISQVGDQYVTCQKNATNLWGHTSCSLLMARNVDFAVGRAIFNGAAKASAQALVALFDSAKWSNAAVGERLSFKKGTLAFTIDAYNPPPPPQNNPNPGNQGGDNGNGGNSSGGSSGGGGNNNPPPPQNNQPQTRQVVIQNMVLNGPSGMIEGNPQIYFSTEMRPTCRLNGCMMPDSFMGSGTVITVDYYSFGQQITNSNLHDPSDDANPDLATSTRWYHGSWNGKSGWINEVWIRADGRGGLGLPQR